MAPVAEDVPSEVVAIFSGDEFPHPVCDPHLRYGLIVSAVLGHINE